MGFFNDIGSALGLGGGSRSNTSAGTSPQDSAPDYGAFSVRGLTSSDQSNYARNQAAANRYAEMDAEREARNPNTDGNNGNFSDIVRSISSGVRNNNGIASIPTATLPNMGGAPGNPEVASLLSALSSMPMFALPNYGSYGSAFEGSNPMSYDYQSVGNPIYGSAGGSNFANMSLSDVFSAYPGLLPSAPTSTGE